MPSPKRRLNSLTALSPLDGRYWSEVNILSDYFSEAALLRYRVDVEVRYLMALSQLQLPQLRRFTKREQLILQRLVDRFNLQAAQRIKKIETITKHDVKAVEYYLKEKLKKTSLRNVIEFIHFGLTSEDINNLAYSVMLSDAVRLVYLPSLIDLAKQLKQLARRYQAQPMLSLTHGQPATPTTLGKELMVYVQRLQRQSHSLKTIRLLGKFGGATGNWAALTIAYPKINWLQFAQRFITGLGLQPNVATTQIESHDRTVELYQAIMRVNSIVKDFDQDMWLYISRGLFKQRNIAGEIGSSAMPHKINPIYFENSEGNAGLANSYCQHFAATLPISRLQRDLTDSTLLRNQGVAMGHAWLALRHASLAVQRVQPQASAMLAELNQHWEVLAEPIQTVLRKYQVTAAYEQLKAVTRGQQCDKTKLHALIERLPIPQSEKITLQALRPDTYVGLSSTIATVQ
ncbi:MAG: adenylosuccinate lyase [Candidatus Kerfeldbacteria bacterium]|nr:adenylosuccinate lyase [Candidatus Kerfeldbacteria bacterium]